MKQKSFYADLKIYDDIDNGYNPMDRIAQTGPSLIDTITIKKMKEYKRWPIPEMLMNRPKANFSLKIDTILADHYREEEMLEWAGWRPAIDVPYNSIDSDDNFLLYHSSDDEIEVDETKIEMIDPEDGEAFSFDLKKLDVSPFRMESMRFYPYKSREGEIPLKLLKIQEFEFIL